MGNGFLAHCKKKITINSKENPTRCVVGLKRTAYCRIIKECDSHKEASKIRRFAKLFKVKFKEGNFMDNKLGKLKCDYCIKPPKIKNKHTSADVQPPFKLDRIKAHPLVCVNDDWATQELYAQISPEISIE